MPAKTKSAPSTTPPSSSDGAPAEPLAAKLEFPLEIQRVANAVVALRDHRGAIADNEELRLEIQAKLYAGVLGADLRSDIEELSQLQQHLALVELRQELLGFQLEDLLATLRNFNTSSRGRLLRDAEHLANFRLGAEFDRRQQENHTPSEQLREDVLNSALRGKQDLLRESVRTIDYEAVKPDETSRLILYFAEQIYAELPAFRAEGEPRKFI